MTQSCPPQPQVSVIVPVYNQERYLEECISSIRRQTLAEWECLIINDGSSDSVGGNRPAFFRGGLKNPLF